MGNTRAFQRSGLHEIFILFLLDFRILAFVPVAFFLEFTSLCLLCEFGPSIKMCQEKRVNQPISKQVEPAWYMRHVFRDLRSSWGCFSASRSTTSRRKKQKSQGEVAKSLNLRRASARASSSRGVRGSGKGRWMFKTFSALYSNSQKNFRGPGNDTLTRMKKLVSATFEPNEAHSSSSLTELIPSVDFDIRNVLLSSDSDLLSNYCPPPTRRLSSSSLSDEDVKDSSRLLNQSKFYGLSSQPPKYYRKRSMTSTISEARIQVPARNSVDNTHDSSSRSDRVLKEQEERLLTAKIRRDHARLISSLPLEATSFGSHRPCSDSSCTSTNSLDYYASSASTPTDLSKSNISSFKSRASFQDHSKPSDLSKSNLSSFKSRMSVQDHLKPIDLSRSNVSSFRSRTSVQDLASSKLNNPTASQPTRLLTSSLPSNLKPTTANPPTKLLTSSLQTDQVRRMTTGSERRMVKSSLPIEHTRHTLAAERRLSTSSLQTEHVRRAPLAAGRRLSTSSLQLDHVRNSLLAAERRLSTASLQTEPVQRTSIVAERRFPTSGPQTTSIPRSPFAADLNDNFQRFQQRRRADDHSKALSEAILEIIMEDNAHDLADLQEFLYGYFHLNTFYQDIIQQFFSDLSDDLVHPNASKAPAILARLALANRKR